MAKKKAETKSGNGGKLGPARTAGGGTKPAGKGAAKSDPKAASKAASLTFDKLVEDVARAHGVPLAELNMVNRDQLRSLVAQSKTQPAAQGQARGMAAAGAPTAAAGLPPWVDKALDMVGIVAAVIAELRKNGILDRAAIPGTP